MSGGMFVMLPLQVVINYPRTTWPHRGGSQRREPTNNFVETIKQISQKMESPPARPCGKSGGGDSPVEKNPGCSLNVNVNSRDIPAIGKQQ